MSVASSLLPPRLRAALTAAAPADEAVDAILAAPLGAIEIAIRSHDEAEWADGLFGTEEFVLAASDDALELMTGVIATLPLQVAMLVGLGPRPVADGEEIAVGDFGAFDDVLSAADLPDAVASAVGAPGALRWRARASWLSSEGPAAREVTVIDGGDGGLLLCSPVPERDEIALVPCSSTDVWRALCALLPYPAELL